MDTEKEKISAVRNQAERWKALRAELEGVEGIDEQCIVDTLEGEIDLKEALLELEEEVVEREALAETLDLRIKAMQARKERILNSAETLRTIILQAMDRAGLDKVQGATATLSVTKYGPDILIEDESVIPSKFFIPQPPKLDKKGLKQAVKDGETVPGVGQTNGKIGLMIRRR